MLNFQPELAQLVSLPDKSINQINLLKDCRIVRTYGAVWLLKDIRAFHVNEVF